MSDPKTDTPDPASADAAATDQGPVGPAPIPSMTAEGGPEAAAADPAARIAELESQLAEFKDRALRALAEAENVRRRTERDKQEAQKYAVAGFARDVLTVGDNLRRALDSIGADARKSSDVMETLVTGVEMTERELHAALERHGIKRVDPLGQRFDSNLHEALYEIPDPTKPAGTIGQVVEVGYLLNDRLLRPAKVGVTKGGPKPEAAPAQPAAEAPGASGNKAYEKDAGAGTHQVDEKL